MICQNCKKNLVGQQRRFCSRQCLYNWKVKNGWYKSHHKYSDTNNGRNTELLGEPSLESDSDNDNLKKEADK